MRADEDKVIVAYEGCAITRRPPAPAALGAFSARPSWPDQFCRKFVAAGRAKRGGNRIFIGLMMNIAVISILLWGRKLRQSGHSRSAVYRFVHVRCPTNVVHPSLHFFRVVYPLGYRGLAAHDASVGARTGVTLAVGFVGIMQ
jgi:hypothetical protein